MAIPRTGFMCCVFRSDWGQNAGGAGVLSIERCLGAGRWPPTPGLSPQGGGARRKVVGTSQIAKRPLTPTHNP